MRFMVAFLQRVRGLVDPGLIKVVVVLMQVCDLSSQG